VAEAFRIARLPAPPPPPGAPGRRRCTLLRYHGSDPRLCHDRAL